MNSENYALCRQAGGELLETSWGRLLWTASRQIGNSQSMSFGRVTIRAGETNPRHRHPNCDEILHLLSGRLEHFLSGARIIMEAGDTIAIPQGAWHQARSIGDEDAEIVICFSSAERLTEIAT
jgi:quercetin dioxygenase-like cupin family protein